MRLPIPLEITYRSVLRQVQNRKVEYYFDHKMEVNEMEWRVEDLLDDIYTAIDQAID